MFLLFCFTCLFYCIWFDFVIWLCGFAWLLCCDYFNLFGVFVGLHFVCLFAVLYLLLLCLLALLIVLLGCCVADYLVSQFGATVCLDLGLILLVLILLLAVYFVVWDILGLRFLLFVWLVACLLVCGLLFDCLLFFIYVVFEVLVCVVLLWLFIRMIMWLFDFVVFIW